MAVFEEFFFYSSTGTNKLHGLKCVPEGPVRAVVQIAHGIAEHIDRYRDFMEVLANNGFLAVGNDHLGHGKSSTVEADRGVFCPEDGWGHVVKDLEILHDIVTAQYPGVKHVMFGHSMGSFLVRTYLMDHPDKYDLAILSGTGHPGKLLLGSVNMMAEHTVKKKGYCSDSTKLNDLSMGGYLKKIENPRTIKVIRGQSRLDVNLLNDLVEKAKGELEVLSAAAEQAKEQLEYVLADDGFEREEYDRLKSWAEIYDSCSFEAKKMFVSKFIKSVYVYRDYELEIEFNVSFDEFRNFTVDLGKEA